MAPDLDFEQELLAERERSGRRERLLEGENEVLRLIVERAPLSSILTQLVRVAEQQGSAGLLASILLMDDDGLHLRHGAAPSLPDTYSRAIDGIEIGPSVGSCGTAAYRREPVVVSDIANDPLWANFKDLAMQHGLRACWSTPVMSSRGQVLATFALYYRKPTRPGPDDRSVIQMLTRTCALAIEAKRAERTLAESEERFRCLSRCSPMGIFTADTHGTFTYVNPKFRELSNYGFERTVDYWLQNAVLPDRAEALVREWDVCSKGLEEFEADLPLGGDPARVVKLRAAPMRSETGSHIGYVGTVEDAGPG
jgi:PAS domain S-box-containing protein